MRSIRWLSIGLLLMTAACVVEEDGAFDEDVAQGTDAVTASNGVRLNGVRLNGVRLNGVRLNGVRLNGVKLAGVTLTGVKLTASQLSGIKSGVAVSGTGMVGATLDGTLSNGTTLSMRIDSAATLAAPNTDVWAYGISYMGDTTWQPLCPDTSPATAIAVAGTWNYGEGVTGGGSYTADATQFTFGCRNTAIAKCVEMGYKPWKTVSGVNLTNHHVACTRMIRADYCGDGKAWTVDGTQINVYDNLGIQADAMDWPTDAEWMTNGARCIHKTRAAALIGTKPPCLAAKTTDKCGKPDPGWALGSLVADEYKP